MSSQQIGSETPHTPQECEDLPKFVRSAGEVFSPQTEDPDGVRRITVTLHNTPPSQLE